MTADDVRADFSAQATKEYFGLESLWLVIGDERIHYHDVGTGEPVVLLHGSAIGVSAAANWWRTIPALARSARVLAPDLAGYGFTEVPDSSYYGITAWTAQIVRFLDAMKLERAILVGNSLGGRIAMQVAIEHPARVTGLVTMGSPSTARQGASAALTRNASPQFTREGIAAVIASLAADGFEVPANLAEFRYQMAVRPGAPERWKEVVAARNASVFATRLTEQDLQKIEHPTLILHGKSDKVISFTESVIGAQHIPNADLAVFAGCGHWVQLEREEDFISAVGGFIRRIASRDGNPP